MPWADGQTDQTRVVGDWEDGGSRLAPGLLKVDSSRPVSAGSTGSVDELTLQARVALALRDGGCPCECNLSTKFGRWRPTTECTWRGKPRTGVFRRGVFLLLMTREEGNREGSRGGRKKWMMGMAALLLQTEAKVLLGRRRGPGGWLLVFLWVLAAAVAAAALLPRMMRIAER